MDPMTIAALGGGLLRGVTSLFGDSEEERRNKQRRRMLQALRGQQEQNRKRAETDKASLNREMSSEKADRRNTLSQKLAQYGYEPGGSIATNEKDLVLGNIQGKDNVMARLEESNQMLDKQYSDIESGIEDTPDAFGTFLGEGIAGANEGINFAKSFGLMDPKIPVGKGINKPGNYTSPSAPVITPPDQIAPQINPVDPTILDPVNVPNGDMQIGDSLIPDYSEMKRKLNMGETGGYAGGMNAPTKYDTPVTSPEVNVQGMNQGMNNINLSLLGEGGNTMLGEGGVGFEMDPMLTDIPNYSDMMSRYNTGGDLPGYKNPFKKNNNALRLKR